MVDFGYNNNAIRNQKHCKPIANGNIADGGMIVLTEEPLPCRKQFSYQKLPQTLEGDFKLFEHFTAIRAIF